MVVTRRMKGELMTMQTTTSLRVFWLVAESTGYRDVDCLKAKLNGSDVTLGTSLEALHEGIDVVFVELPGFREKPALILDAIREASPTALILFWNPNGSVKEAVELVKQGIFHYMAYPEHVPADELARWIGAAAQKLSSNTVCLDPIQQFHTQIVEEPWRRYLVGNSAPMEQLAVTVRLLAMRRSTVLITGETGTGKEIVAKALHLASPRGKLPMVAVNCTALPEALLESELFGHTKGAFTGAAQARPGRFEQADKSTIFLDEIGDMPVETQAKLLRVLQEKEIQRLGSSEVQKVDVRVIAATNVDLELRCREGKFREDLFYRLNVVPVKLPALRERLDDIPLLVEHFLNKISEQEEMPVKSVTREALEHLKNYHWPGNVRQLENAVDRAITLSGDRNILIPSDFAIGAASNSIPRSNAANISLDGVNIDFEAMVNRLERELIDQALRRTQGNKKRAADILGLKRTTLAAKLKSLEAVAS